MNFIISMALRTTNELIGNGFSVLVDKSNKYSVFLDYHGNTIIKDISRREMITYLQALNGILDTLDTKFERNEYMRGRIN